MSPHLQEESAPAPVQYRLATSEDAPGIVDLLNRTFRTPADEAAWNWFTTGNPLGPSRVYLSIESEEQTIVGLFGFSPIRLRMDGEVIEGCYAHHLALDSRYRDGLSFLALSRYSLEREKERQTRIVVGPPNRQAYPVHKTLMKWYDFGGLDSLRKLQPSPKEHRCELLNLFTGEFDSLYERVSKPLQFCMEKNAARMNWRFFERPASPYTVYCARNGDGLSGYVVLKPWRDADGYRKVHILDIHAVDQDSFTELIGAAESHASGCNELNLWAVEGYVYREWFEAAGFEINAAARQPFIARTFNGVRSPFPQGKASLSYGDGDSQY